MSELQLPREPQAPQRIWRGQRFVMIGAGKIGKSDFWSQDKKALFLDCEGGLKHLTVMRVPVQGWEDVRTVYAALMKAQQAGDFPYDTIVIDTLDRFISYANEEVIDRAKQKFKKDADNINTIGDIPNGAGWAWATELIRNTLAKFEELPVALVLIGHVANKEIKEPTRTIHKDTINIGGQTGTGILHWADHTLHLQAVVQSDGVKRTVRTKPTAILDAGSRGNVVPDGWQWEPDMANNFAALRKLFT